MPVAPYPLLLEPLLYSKVWGGDRLARFGKAVAPGSHIGESWELADMNATSAAGAGGGAARSKIAAGPLAGQTLGDALRQWGEALLGETHRTRDATFPLLVKFLDARESLSVQVHPSPAFAAQHANAFLKTECWYILDAEPGAVVYKGVREGVSFDEFSRRVRDGTVSQVMIEHPAIRGECHNLPSGTVHALGAGVLVAEVQTPSDTTYRLFDWGRAGREMHFDAGLASAAANWEPEAGTAIRAASTVRRRAEGEPRTRLVTTEFFTVDELAVPSGAPTLMPLEAQGRCAVLTVIGGEAEWSSDAGTMPLRLGATAVIPAAIVDAGGLRSASGATVLCAIV